MFLSFIQYISLSFIFVLYCLLLSMCHYFPPHQMWKKTPPKYLCSLQLHCVSHTKKMPSLPILIKNSYLLINSQKKYFVMFVVWTSNSLLRTTSPSTYFLSLSHTHWSIIYSIYMNSTFKSTNTVLVCLLEGDFVALNTHIVWQRWSWMSEWHVDKTSRGAAEGNWPLQSRPEKTGQNWEIEGLLALRLPTKICMFAHLGMQPRMNAVSAVQTYLWYEFYGERFFDSHSYEERGIQKANREDIS